MKKLFLLMALVLTAGVVQAQGLNFGQRANLTQAVRLDAEFPSSTWKTNGTGTVNGVDVTYYNGWDADEKKLFWSGNPGGSQEVTIFSHDYITHYLNGRSLLDVFENFVIRAKDASEWKHYYGQGPSSEVTYNSSDNTAVTYAVCFYSGNTLLSTMMFWSGDVKIAPLRALCQSDKATELRDDEINNIDRVTIKSNSPNGQVYIEEAYFISALKELDYKDKNGIDIGNAYIDPSYLIRSNHLWVEINDADRTFYMVADGSNKGGTLAFSLPYWQGIDMSDVTFTALDFDRNANVLERCIYENKRVDLHRNPTKPDPDNGIYNSEYADYVAKSKDVLVRDLYNSRYNGPFYDQNGGYALDLTTRGDVYLTDKAIKHVNSIYWESVSGTTERRILCQDMSLTKNTIKARKTRKELQPDMWSNPDAIGFRYKMEYPIQPYYENEDNWSDVVRGDWNTDNFDNLANFSRYNKMRITGSPNTTFDIRFTTNPNIASKEELQAIVVKTDAHGEVNVDLGNYEHFLLHAILFHDDEHNALGLYNVRAQIGRGAQNGQSAEPGLRDHLWVNDIEMFEGEGRLVDLVGSSDPSNTANMYHVYNVDNNYQWQYGTIVRWAVNQGDQSQFTQDNNVSDGAVIWGSMGLYPQNYADLTGYKAIRVYSDTQFNDGDQVRFVFNTLKNTGTQTGSIRGDIRVRLNKAVDDHQYYPELNGLYYAELDISNYEYFHLNGIKALAGFEVKAIKLVEDEEADYVCYGNGSCFEQKRAAIDPSVEKAVGDATAKVIDMRARCNNMEEPFDYAIYRWVQQTQLPYTANPNVLYIQRTNQFESRKTVDNADTYAKVNFITPSNNKDVHEFTSNNIELTDGFSFYAPKMIKAENATYTRTFSYANVVNSVILPFDVSAGNEDYKTNKAGFYKTTSMTQSQVTLRNAAGILEEQDVQKGDWLLKFSKVTGKANANVPYLYAVTTNTGEKDFTGVKDGGVVIIPETPDVTSPTTGEGSLAPNSGDSFMEVEENGEIKMKEGYYLRGTYEGTYMKDILFFGADGKLYRTPCMTVTPFRTIIHSPIPVTDSSWLADQNDYFGVRVTEANDVKVLLAYEGDDEALGIDNVADDGTFVEDAPIYNVAGQRVNSLNKGIYIVGGKKILVK
jgi:hypothetical protein